MHEAKLLIQRYHVTLQVSTIFHLEPEVSCQQQQIVHPRIKRFSIAGPREQSHAKKDGWRTVRIETLLEASL